MQENPHGKTKQESPFWGLLAEARAVRIREVSTEDGGQPGDRAFLVNVSSTEIPTSMLPPEGEPLDRDYFLENAILLSRNGEHILARHIYGFLLKENPRDERALAGLGTCMLRLGQANAARKCFQAALEIERREDTLLSIAQCFVAEGDDELALKHLVQVNPSKLSERLLRFTLFKELGNCHTRRAEWDRALSCYGEALAIEPGSDVVYANLGTLEAQRSRFDEARRHCLKALELNPGNTRARCGLGIVFVQLGDDAAAEREFFSVLDQDSQNAIAIHHCLILAHRKNDFSAIKERILRFLEKDSRNADIHYALAAILFREGDWRACRSRLEQALKTDPAHQKARSLLEEVGNHRHRG